MSTTLELLFDLTFVVAVARVAAQLAHAVETDQIGDAIVGYFMVFFAIWWAWMNFTWFASAYDCDDVPYRLLTLLQMTGVLILAAGVPGAFTDKDFKTITAGYVVMRVAMIVQWLRAALSDEDHRATCLGYAGGIALVQIGWIARLALPDGLVVVSFVILAAAEISVPLLTERQGMTPWHPHHIAERYGLFTIIVLGESVTAASNALSGAFEFDGLTSRIVLLALGGVVLLFGMWWIYFLHDTGDALVRRRDLSFVWGYSHYFLSAAAAAVGATLEAAALVDLEKAEALASGEHALDVPSGRVIALAVAVSVSAYLLLTAYIHGRLTETHVPTVVDAGVACVAMIAIALLIGPSSVPVAIGCQGLTLALLIGYASSRSASGRDGD